MTEPQTDTNILDEELLKEIEAVAGRAESIAEDFYPSEIAIVASVGCVPKLTATIRNLRAENEVYKAVDYSALTSDADPHS